jgi:hypothetical protein
MEACAKVPVNTQVSPALSAERAGEEEVECCFLSMFRAHGVGVVISLQLAIFFLQRMLRTFSPATPWQRIWKSWAPGKCKIFLWLAVKNRCWTTDRLARKGLP